VKKVCIIIPCYNEAKNIAATVKDVLSQNSSSFDFFPLVINDCSVDETVKTASEAGGTVIDLPCNLGVGGAVQAGFKYALRNDFDYAVKFDGDGQHKAEYIATLLEPLENDTADMVIGSRFCQEHDGFKSTPTRMIGIKLFRYLNSFLTGQTVTDNTSGFRAYNREALEFASIHYPAFDYPEPEEVVLMLSNRFRLLEQFVEMQPRQGGESTINPMKSVYFMLKVVFAILMVAMRKAVREEQS